MQYIINLRLGTAIFALITRRSTTTVYTVWVVTLDQGRFIHEVSIAHQVETFSIAALPVLLAAVRVRVPAIRLAGAVQVMATVKGTSSSSRGSTVLVALITDWSLATAGVLQEVAAIILNIKHLRIALVIIGAKEMFSLSLLVQAMPVPPAVELIWKPACSEIFAADGLVLWGAVWGDSWGVLTVCIAVITDRSSVTLGVCGKVATTIGKIIHLGVSIFIIRAHDVFSFSLSLVTMPVLPTVVLIRVVSSSHLLAVNDLFLRCAVRHLSGCGQWGGAMDSIVARSTPTVNITRIGAPGIYNVKFIVIRTCLMGHTPGITFIVLPARLRIRNLDIVVCPTSCSIG